MIKEISERALHTRVYSGKPGRSTEAAWPHFFSASKYNCMMTCAAKFNGH